MDNSFHVAKIIFNFKFQINIPRKFIGIVKAHCIFLCCCYYLHVSVTQSVMPKKIAQIPPSAGFVFKKAFVIHYFEERT